MKPSNTLLLVGLLILGTLGLIGGIVLLSTSLWPSTEQPLRTAIMAQSQQYVETLGAQPFATLSSEQQLLVLHASYNLEKYATVIHCAEAMLDVFRQMEPARKQAFGAMVQEAYRQLGKHQEAMTFGQRIGL